MTKKGREGGRLHLCHVYWGLYRWSYMMSRACCKIVQSGGCRWNKIGQVIAIVKAGGLVFGGFLYKSHFFNMSWKFSEIKKSILKKRQEEREEKESRWVEQKDEREQGMVRGGESEERCRESKRIRSPEINADGGEPRTPQRPPCFVQPGQHRWQNLEELTVTKSLLGEESWVQFWYASSTALGEPHLHPSPHARRESESTAV